MEDFATEPAAAPAEAIAEPGTGHPILAEAIAEAIAEPGTGHPILAEAIAEPEADRPILAAAPAEPEADRPILAAAPAEPEADRPILGPAADSFDYSVVDSSYSFSQSFLQKELDGRVAARDHWTTSLCRLALAAIDSRSGL